MRPFTKEALQVWPPTSFTIFVTLLTLAKICLGLYHIICYLFALMAVSPPLPLKLFCGLLFSGFLNSIRDSTIAMVVSRSYAPRHWISSLAHVCSPSMKAKRASLLGKSEISRINLENSLTYSLMLPRCVNRRSFALASFSAFSR